MGNKYKIGIDIGGTRTHAVLCENDKIIVSVDVPTTTDTSRCVREAIDQIKADANTSSISPDDITAVMIGTTRFVNNILERKGLNKVLVIRLAAPATTAIPPLADWPGPLKQLIGENCFIIAGGYEFTGNEISAVDYDQVKALGEEAVRLGIQNIAVSGVFSHIKPEQEDAVYKILKSVNPDFRISLSHQIGDLGFLARENATILNASLSLAFETFCQGIQSALIDTHLSSAKLYISTNNGTIEHANTIFPVQTYGSGPSNSIRGASQLGTTESEYFIVADIGGTSTDIGINHNGFPLSAGTEIKIGNEGDGFICNFPSPLTFSCGLGGGSIVLEKNGDITIGPESVGQNIQRDAISFGGNVLTVTDIAIAKGRMNSFGDLHAVKQNISQQVIDKADDMLHQKLAAMINMAVPYVDKDQQFPVVLVGGGAVVFDLEKLKPLLDKSVHLIIVPPNASSANAIGASIAKISGQFSRIYQYQDTPEAKGMPREEAINNARQRAIADAVKKGANPETVKELGLTEVPLNYLAGALNNIKVEVIGEFQNTTNNTHESFNRPFMSDIPLSIEVTPNITAVPIDKKLDADKQYFADMALGAAVLGSGGGGDTYLSEVMLNQFLEKGMRPNIIDLKDVNDEMTIIAVGEMGAPSVGHEKLPSAEQLIQVVKQLENKLNKKIDALVVAEGGGTNAIYPLSVAIATGLPIINADCMGRAFPQLRMTTPYIYGGEMISPILVLANGKNSIVLDAPDLASLEKQANVAVKQMGASVSIACMPMSGKQAKSWCVANTLTFCHDVGAAIRFSKSSDRVSVLRDKFAKSDYGTITSLGSGKIIELNHHCDEGRFNRGWMMIETATHERIKIEFQNENLRATNCSTNHVLAAVPDIITLLDVKGRAISCELLRVGLDVSVITIAAPAILKTPEALAVVGPEQFNLQPLKHVRSEPGITFMTDNKTAPEVNELASNSPRMGAK